MWLFRLPNQIALFACFVFSAIDGGIELCHAQEVDIFVGKGFGADLTVPLAGSPFVAWHTIEDGKTMCHVANTRTGQTQEAFPLADRIHATALSPDGELYAAIVGQSAAAAKDRMVIYSTASGKVVKEFQPDEFRSVGRVEFLSPRQLLVLGFSQTSGGALYGVSTGKQEQWLEIPVQAMKYRASADGKWFACHREGDSFALIDTKTGKQTKQIKLEGDSNYAIPHVSDLAFCNDDKDLAVISSEGSCGFRIYDVKTGKLKVRFRLDQGLERIAPLWAEYKGPVVENLPDDRGWLLYGRAIVDPVYGGPVWVEPQSFKGMSAYKLMYDGDTQLSLMGDSGKERIKATKFPREEIVKSRDAYVIAHPEAAKKPKNK